VIRVPLPPHSLQEIAGDPLSTFPARLRSSLVTVVGFAAQFPVYSKICPTFNQLMTKSTLEVVGVPIPAILLNTLSLYRFSAFDTATPKPRIVIFLTIYQAVIFHKRNLIQTDFAYKTLEMTGVVRFAFSCCIFAYDRFFAFGTNYRSGCVVAFIANRITIQFKKNYLNKLHIDNYRTGNARGGRFGRTPQLGYQ